MRAGTLRHRVTIQSRTETQNSFGETTWTWADWKTVWAEVVPVGGREFFAAKEVQAQEMIRIRIRYQAGITQKHRVKWTDGETDRYFAIESVIPLREARREIQLMCRERIEDGWRD